MLLDLILGLQRVLPDEAYVPHKRSIRHDRHLGKSFLVLESAIGQLRYSAMTQSSARMSG